MRYLILLLLAGPVCAQDVTPSAWTNTGRIENDTQIFMRWEKGDTTAVEIYNRNPFRLNRIDVNLAGTCYWAIPDEDGSITWMESVWEDTCRDFDFSSRLFDDGQIMSGTQGNKRGIF